MSNPHWGSSKWQTTDVTVGDYTSTPNAGLGATFQHISPHCEKGGIGLRLNAVAGTVTVTVWTYDESLKAWVTIASGLTGTSAPIPISESTKVYAQLTAVSGATSWGVAYLAL